MKIAFEAARGLPSHISEIPYIGGEYAPRARRALHADLKRRVYAALLARKRHSLTAPRWAQPLPLREYECIELQRDADNKLKLVGHFAASWRKCDWDEQHPLFAEFCCILLYPPAVPECLERDYALQSMFPSLPLPHLDADLCWRA
jgi:hypothetical protein